MSESFDPYYKWLGIKPKDQPPNHYRLLGVEMFESDADVIENAADQRMRHMRSLQAGAHADASQQILNEVAAARVCLLDPVKRAEYDRQLRAEQILSRAAPPRQAAPPLAARQAIPPPGPPVGVAVAPPVADRQASPSGGVLAMATARSHTATATMPRNRAASRRQSGFPIALAASAVGFIAVVILAIVLMRKSKSQPEFELRPPPNPIVDRAPPPQKSGTKTASSPLKTQPPKTPPAKTPPPEPPKPTGELHLLEIPAVTLAPGEPLRVQAKLRNPERWKDQVEYAVGLGVPLDTKVDAKTGWLEWTPPKDARSTYLFNIEAHAGADQDSTTFQVTLPWARGELVFTSPGDRTAYPGEPVAVPLSARDDLGPAAGATFELLSGPAGAVVDPGTHQFRWQAGEGQIDTRQPVSVKVTDARGVSAKASFTIRVEKKPVPKDDDASDKEGEPRRPDMPDRPRGRNYLQFSGNGYVETSWRYDGSTPLTLEVIASPDQLRRCAVLGCMHLSGVGITMTGDGKWAFVAQDKNGSHQIASDQPAALHRSDHVAGVLDNGKMSLFVNGVLQKETARIGAFVPSRHALLIGADTNGEGHAEAFFQGHIRLVRASNVVRYRESFPRPFRLKAEDGTTLLLQFNHGSGDEVRDRSGKNPPARIRGAVWMTR